MTDLIQEAILPFLVYFQILTALIISWYGFKLKEPAIKGFIIFFWYTALNEFVGSFYVNYIDNEHNAIVYNVYYFVTFCYLFGLYHFYIRNKTFKWVIVSFVAIYIASMCYELFFLKMNYFEKFEAIPYIIAGVSILICILFYFYEVLDSKEIIKIERKVIFWISIAYLFYYLAMIPFKVEQNFYASEDSLKYLFNIRILTTLFYNLILIFGFIWSKKEDY